MKQHVAFTAEIEFVERIQSAAKKERRSVSSFLRYIIEKYLDSIGE